MIDLIFDPSVWFGLLTLVLLEIILGIDNLVFVAILADKLPPKQQDKARLFGLSLALIMRLGLLSIISWTAALTNPLISIADLTFSGRDLILLVGGLFLLFKATVELHERLENSQAKHQENRIYASFWGVVVQIVVLDAIFSLDAVITAVGMVSHLPVMMLAVVIAVGLMFLASKLLTNFVNNHPTVVVLCLSFLLMIGLSLVLESFGFRIPKGYLYVAIGFSIVIECFNQISQRNFIRNQARRPMRERTAEVILRLIGGRQYDNDDLAKDKNSILEKSAEQEGFKEEERYMISSVLELGSRSIQSIMTPRKEISWVDIEQEPCKIRTKLLDTPHSLFPICRGKLDEVIGVVRAKELLVAIEQNEDIIDLARNTPPIIVYETLDTINLIGVLRRARGSLVIVTAKSGIVQGLITPLDVLEAIAGEFPDEDEKPDIFAD